MKKCLLILTAFCLLPLHAVSAVYRVGDFGAKGDGITKDTKAVQAAIDAAGAAGGGTVELGPGTYLCGSLWLRDHVDLHVGAGAVLLGSPDIEDYCAGDCCPQNAASPRTSDNTTGGHLLLGVGVKHVTVRGPGRIDGNSPAFLSGDGGGYNSKFEIPVRPAQMVWFVDCSDIRISDLEMSNAPYWTCFILNCNRVWIRGCHVHTERDRFRTFNGDGIDVDRCQFVEISDCLFDTFDDCLTLRASTASRLAAPQDCAWITVTNCNLSSSCNAIRVGVGEGSIHDISISNVNVYNSRIAFNFVASWSQTSRGTDISGVRISGARIEAAAFLKMYHKFSTEAIFRDILLSDVSGSVKEDIQIIANESMPFRNIVLQDIGLDCGIKAENAEVVVRGGTLRR